MVAWSWQTFENALFKLHLVSGSCHDHTWISMVITLPSLGKAAPKKKRSNFGTFPKGGGLKAQSKVKGALFATDRFPLGSLSSYPTSMMVLHFSYLINSTLEPSLCVVWLKQNIKKCWSEKVLPGGPKYRGGGTGTRELWESSKGIVRLLFFSVQLPLHLSMPSMHN